MTISHHLKTFAGLPVKNYEPGKKRKATQPCVWRLRCLELDPGEDIPFSFLDLLTQFLEEHGGRTTTALVTGAWKYEDMMEWGRGAGEVVEALVGGRDQLPNLKHLFFGDITYQECEISWIGHGDISALLPAFAKLEEFAIRGTSNLSFGKLSHPKLKSLTIQSGGLRPDLLKEVFAADLPKLESLELWLGSSNYGGVGDAEPLKPLLAGKLFPKLKHLGLRNCEIADKVASAVAESPLLTRLHTLDLSLGNLADAGAEALLKSAGVRKLKKLDLHHNYLSQPFLTEVKKLPMEVDVGDVQTPDFHTYGDTTDVYRNITVAE